MAALPGYSPGLMGFSPADFGDAEDTRPTEIFLDPTATGSRTPYTTIVSNIAARQSLEIREKATSPSFTPASWRRRMKEFLTQKNEGLLEFLPKPFSQHPVLSPTDQLMRRFGRVDFQANQANLRDVCMDGSGVQVTQQIEEELQKLGKSSSQELAAQIRYLLDTYREAGEAILTKENQLLQKLAALDKVQQKVINMNEMPVNDASAALSEAVEKYVEKVFDEHKIEDTYKELMVAYRKFAALRELIQFLRTTDMSHQEPLCSICLQETVAFALVPCGHTFCTSCGKRQMMQCFICRSHIRERTKIFFG
jgi:paraquat-inducible protein B